MSLFKNKYRVETTRLKDWDYASAGYYFVTLCTRQRDLFFGEVNEGEIHLSDLGNIAASCWLAIPQHFPYVSLDEFVIMPNHVHGVIVIHGDEDQQANVETRHVASLHRQSPDAGNRFGPLKPGSVSKIIQAYKAAVTKWSRENSQAEFGWQPRFYDHIIRNDTELGEIRRYIVNNPAKWDLERNNPENIWM